MGLKKWFQRKDKDILENFQGGKIILKSNFANFFGQESKGRGQIRGNGLLILTEDELFFAMYLPKREFHIPIRSISNIETTNKHLGKTKLRALLKVNFSNEIGNADSCAWLVGDLDKWIQVLSETAFKKN